MCTVTSIIPQIPKDTCKNTPLSHCTGIPKILKETPVLLFCGKTALTEFIIYWLCAYQHNMLICNNINHTTDGLGAYLMEKLKGEFCYIQTTTGRIVSIHYSPTNDEESINVKRGIAGAFQANFDNQTEVEESDPGSTHISHYRYA